jgi:hypothetical protein
MPLVLGWTTLIWAWQIGFKQIWQQFRKNFWPTIGLKILAISLSLVLLWPLISNLASPVISQRFAETSLLTDLTPIIQSNQLIAANHQTWWAKLIYHRYWFQAKLVSQQFLKHLDLGFLFLHGDSNARHSIQYFGQLYYLDAVFGLIGAFFIWKKQSKLAIWLAGWWLIGTLPAAISIAAPHALRTLPTWPVWILLISFGIGVLTAKKTWLLSLIVLGYTGLLIWFWLTYTLIYPQLYGQNWQTGYCEMYQNLKVLTTLHPELPVYVARTEGRPAMYYWFCNQIDPKLVQTANQIVKKDQGEFLEFNQYHFVGSAAEMPASYAITATHSANGWQINLR